MNVEMVSWDAFHHLARDLALRIRESGYRPDMVIAIARGGVVPARVLCDYLDIMEMTCIRIEHYRARKKAPEARVKYPLNASVDGLRILVVDDVSDTGDSFIAAIAHIKEKGTPLEVRTCALQHKTVSKFVPDHYAHEISQWRWVTYPWAVIEDLGELIESAGLLDQEADAIIRELKRRHGVEPSLEQVHDAMQALRDRQPE
ncbi:MAG: phosphoribosyltransferase [Halothiobacillaceae bacterium]|nr:MAG: phosphoribosyltransferase [Halothiobacillaceae bacterium]